MRSYLAFMVTDIPAGDLYPPIILLSLTALLSIIFIDKRRRTSVNALDWLIAVFLGMSAMGVMQLLKLYFADEWTIFIFASDQHSLPVDPVRFLHLSVLLILFFMCGQFLGPKYNIIRLMVMTFFMSIYLALTILYVSTNTIVLVSDVFPGLQEITMDSVIFDSFQLYTAIMLFYVYYEQYRVSDNAQIRRFLVFLLIAIGIFVGSSVAEILEVFIPNFDPNGFLLTIPTFLIIAWFYIKYPNFVYLAPSKVQFLQIVSKRGELLYAAELQEELGISDFLIAPSLTSVNSLLGELIGDKNLEVKQFEFTNGNILFEQIGDIQIILQTDRPAGILKRSMRYMLRVFTREFQDQIDNFTGFVGVNDNNISPDDVLRQCIPIVLSKPLTSSYLKAKPNK